MRIVIQRVTRAEIVIDGRPGGGIGRGFVALAGFRPGAGAREVDALAAKLCALRVFEDAGGRMNLSLEEVNGGCLLVPNFTLYADCRKGRRPSFAGAARPEEAEPLFDRLCERVRAAVPQTVLGRFGADMQVALENDGPVTVILDSDQIL